MTSAQKMQAIKTMFIADDETSNAFLMYLAMIEDSRVPAQTNVLEAVNTLYHVARHFILNRELDNVG